MQLQWGWAGCSLQSTEGASRYAMSPPLKGGIGEEGGGGGEDGTPVLGGVVWMMSMETRRMMGSGKFDTQKNMKHSLL